MPSEKFEQQLNQAIQQMLDDASVSVQTLPQCEQIKLWLVEPSAMQRPFSQEEILRIQQYPAYWAFCWASGQVLAPHPCQHLRIARPSALPSRKTAIAYSMPTIRAINR